MIGNPDAGHYVTLRLLRQNIKNRPTEGMCEGLVLGYLNASTSGTS